MAISTALSTPVAPCSWNGSWALSPCENPLRNRRWYDIQSRPDHDILLEEGEFQVNSSIGYRYIGKFTGRTRKFRGSSGIENFQTVDLYEIDTVVEMLGEQPVLFGRRGAKVPGGTWYTAHKARVFF